MIYRELGKTGLKVSRLGFGAMRPPRKEDGETVDTDMFVAVMHRAIDQGVTYIDTANVYQAGVSEECVARAVVGRRDQIVISTKVPLQDTAKKWQEMLDGSMKRFSHNLDVLFLHGIRMEQTSKRSFDAIMRRAERAVEKGWTRVLGFSCHDTPENIIKFLDMGVFKVMLVQYNLLNRTNEGVLAYAHERGVGAVLMGPVAGGMLATPSRTLRRISPVPVKSLAELALRFVLSNPNVDAALSGMNDFAMVDENCATASQPKPMAATARKKLVKAVQERLSTAEKICTACGYCMPCLKGISIPRAFRALQMKRVWGMDELAQKMYDSLGNERRGPKSAKLEACVKCGACEVKCPQGIAIRKQLEEVIRVFGGKSG